MYLWELHRPYAFGLPVVLHTWFPGTKFENQIWINPGIQHHHKYQLCLHFTNEWPILLSTPKQLNVWKQLPLYLLLILWVSHLGWAQQGVSPGATYIAAVIQSRGPQTPGLQTVLGTQPQGKLAGCPPPVSAANFIPPPQPSPQQEVSQDGLTLASGSLCWLLARFLSI